MKKTNRIKILLNKPTGFLSEVGLFLGTTFGVVSVFEAGKATHNLLTSTHEEKIKAGLFKKEIITVRDWDGKILK